MRDFLHIMKALSDKNRVKIIKMLEQRQMCVCEIQKALGISQPSVSRHLKILEGAGLVGFRKQGQWVNYFLTNGKENPYAAVLLGNLRHWLEDDPEIRELFIRLPEIRREDIIS